MIIKHILLLECLEMQIICLLVLVVDCYARLISDFSNKSNVRFTNLCEPHLSLVSIFCYISKIFKKYIYNMHVKFIFSNFNFSLF